MLKKIALHNTSFEINEIAGVSKSFVTKPDDKLIFPIDSGCRFDVSEDFPDIIGTHGFNSRSMTLGMILMERDKNYLALVPEDTIDAKCRIYRNDRGLLEAAIISDGNIRELTGSLKEIIASYRNLRGNLHVTLDEKVKRLPELERFAHSAIVYIWQDDYEKLMYSNKDEKISVKNPDGILKIADRLRSDGIKDIMFGIFFRSDQPAVNELRKLGFMASKYDNYNDVPPADLCEILPKARIDECDYLKRRIGGYPDKIQTGANGSLWTAWELDGLDGKRHSQFTMCPLCAVEAMKKEIPEEIKGSDYTARFIDVFGTGLSECHSPSHRFTRRESVGIKRSAFEFLTDIGLIPGTEDGCEALAPAVCYNEGIASPVYFRYDWREAGRKKARLYETEEAAAWFRKYMLNPEHRFPLWELCWRDSVISYPYWGDSLLCCPAVAKERILMAALFAEPPLYSFFEKDFEKLEELIVCSYNRLREVLDAVGNLPMTDFEKLSDSLYSSEFGGKLRVIANFSDEEKIADGKVIPPMEFCVIE